jgi:competence protein ComEC
VRYRTKIFWLIIVCIATLRFIFFLLEDSGISDLCFKKNLTGLGTIIDEPISKDSGQTLVIAVKHLEFSGSIQSNSIVQENIDSSNALGGYSQEELSSLCTQEHQIIKMKVDLYPKYSFGDIISFSGRLSPPYNFRSEDGRTFNYRGFLAKDGIYSEIRSAKVVLIDKDSLPNSDTRYDLTHNISQYITGTLFEIKRGFVNNLNKVLGEPHSALAAGLVVGEKAALGKDLLDDFRKVGLIHIIVLSGFNITIVADALRRILSIFPRKLAIIFGGMGMILFCIMVGGGATVIRSCLMGSLALFADLSRRDYNVLRALSFAGLLMVIQNPSIIIFDPSFQLSFLATLGLIILASPIERFLPFITDKFGIRGIVASTFATQIFVSPFILYMTGDISIVGVLVNIIVLPIIPLSMLFVFLSGLFGFIFIPISQIFAWVTHFLLSYELFIVEHSAKLPLSSIHIEAFPFLYVVLFYVLFTVIMLVTIYFRRKTSLHLS